MRGAVFVLCVVACGNKSAQVSADDAAVATVSIDARVAERVACSDQLVTTEIADGVRVESIRAWLKPPLPVGDRCFTLVRIDPRAYQMKLLTESEHGKRLSAPQWAKNYGLVAATNASMFHEDGKSTGLMVSGDHVNNSTVNKQFGAFMAFDPVDPKAAPVVMQGEGCDGFDLAALRKSYRVVVQNYRLLDCAGDAIEWKDQKIYSAAAVAVDEDGHVVFVLMRTPYKPKAFAEMLASPKLRLTAAMYVEGGPEASIFVSAGGTVLDVIGSYETLFREDDGNSRAWPIPNVIGAAPR